MYFSKHQVSSFLITNGTKEIIVYSNGAIFEKMDISSFPVSHKILTELQSDPHLKGDTTGCGDNFAGGVIANTAEQLKSKDRGKLDLIEALSWGVASGGFACYYLGGTFCEKKQGEKLEIIKSYQIDYLKQIDKYEFIDK
jgi:sugar/nucleoside kinase (ribokinase family)